MTETRLPKQLVWAVAVVCVLPFLLTVIGADFGSPAVPLDLSGAAAMSAHEFDDALHHALTGSHLHTILEWTAFCAALFTAVLSFTQFSITRNTITPIGLSTSRRN